MNSCRMLTAVGVMVAAGQGVASAQVVLGQADTFEDGTTLGWGVGAQHPTPPSNVADGGPGGAGDAFLQLTSAGGAGPGSRLSAFNTSQWAGNYAAAGVTVITMDVNNFGTSEVHLRLGILDPMGAGPTNFAITDAVVVQPGSGWVTATFAIDESSLITLVGSAADALSGATELRLFHNPDPDYPSPPIGPPAIAAVVGVDNIRAIPGVGAAWVMAGGMAGMAAGCRRRR